jgi:hypothetical protein
VLWCKDDDEEEEENTNYTLVALPHVVKQIHL